MKIKVSILIPCFNAEKWIAKAIQSALDQNHEIKEVIVFDDGSSDGSVEQIEAFKGRIRFEVGPNRGGNVARNRLLELAEGDWVQFLDADDYLTPNKIERQLDFAHENVDLIYSPISVETWNLGEVKAVTVQGPDSQQSIEEQWIRWRVAQTGSVLWKASSLRQIGGWNEKFPCCQDNEVAFRAIKNGLTFAFCGDAGAVYRIWSEDTVCRVDPKNVIKYKTRLIDEMLGWLRSQNRLTDAHDRAAGQAFFEMARTLSQHHLAEAQQYVNDRKSKGSFLVVGPAATLSFRLACKLIGFSNAERLAVAMRRLKKVEIRG